MATILFKFSSPSSGRSSDSLQILPRRDYLLSILYEDTTDELRFNRVESLRVTHYKACTIDMIAMYGRVVNLGETSWLASVRTQLVAQKEPVEELCHLVLYLDDGPYYEFVCHGFSAITVDNV